MSLHSGVCILLALAGSSSFSVLQAGSIDAIYSFGDSLSDVGNVYSATGVPGPPYANGQFSNGNVWVQDLASDLGLSPLMPSLTGGTDYAYGTGETGVTSFNTSLPVTDLLGTTGQLAQFQMTHSTADPNALYTIWIGSNDLTDILAASPTPADAAADVGTVVANIDTAIGLLANLGATNFLIVNVPDLGKTPAALADGPIASAAASALSASFDQTLMSGAGPLPSLSTLASGDSINISVLNSYALLDSIIADPAMYGFTDVTNPCYTGTYEGFANSADPGTVCATPNQNLFWDATHPTAAGQELVADAAVGLVTPEPASISLIIAGLSGLLVIRRRGLGRV